MQLGKLYQKHESYINIFMIDIRYQEDRRNSFEVHNSHEEAAIISRAINLFYKGLDYNMHAALIL